MWASEARRVLKPGGHLVAFGAPRTFHRLTAGIEDAGLEVRDQLLWLYAQGLPKSRRLPGGLGTSLKPAYEPILLARAPFIGTTARNLDAWGTGALNIDAARITGSDHRPGTGPPTSRSRTRRPARTRRASPSVRCRCLTAPGRTTARAACSSAPRPPGVNARPDVSSYPRGRCSSTTGTTIPPRVVATLIPPSSPST